MLGGNDLGRYTAIFAEMFFLIDASNHSAFEAALADVQPFASHASCNTAV